ncbi:hypothetical protein [Flavobacterium alkalisoli]|uniref:hypothetical protein n=1 Tax=Flavobacterium alkalisoli TaxID=2602769 RepID=UPI003A912DC2
MKQDQPQIHVFKTDITEHCSNCEVAKKLNSHPEIQDWSIDCDDTDCVLRVVSKSINANDIIELVLSAGHSCAELV